MYGGCVARIGEKYGVQITPVGSRAGAVIDMFFPYRDKIITCDGYATAYGKRFCEL